MRRAEVTQEERKQERETCVTNPSGRESTMDNNTLCYFLICNVSTSSATVW